MVRDSTNIIPVSMAMLLHVALFASMFVAFDWSRPTPITPMAIRATLVPEIREQAPPRWWKEPEPEPEPKPEPVVEAPKPEPDNSEELRREAEEKKRLQDALIEKDRLEKIRQQEEAERKRKEQEAADKKKAEEDRKRARTSKRRNGNDKKTSSARKMKMNAFSGNWKLRSAKLRSTRKRIDWRR